MTTKEINRIDKGIAWPFKVDAPASSALRKWGDFLAPEEVNVVYMWQLDTQNVLTMSPEVPPAQSSGALRATPTLSPKTRALREWLESDDSLDWDAVERARDEAWGD